MAESKTKLSPLREVYCINCHITLLPNLAERRGEKELVCPDCDTSFTIKEAEAFINKLSPLEEGFCPACNADLSFDIEDRSTEEKIQCPACKDLFYMDEVSEVRSPTRKEIPTEDIGPIEILLKNYKIYVIFSLFLDFFLIFTILSLTESSKIKKVLWSWEEEDKIQYNTWHTVFVIGVIIRVFLFVIGFLSY